MDETPTGEPTAPEATSEVPQTPVEQAPPVHVAPAPNTHKTVNWEKLFYFSLPLFFALGVFGGTFAHKAYIQQLPVPIAPTPTVAVPTPTTAVSLFTTPKVTPTTTLPRIITTTPTATPSISATPSATPTVTK